MGFPFERTVRSMSWREGTGPLRTISVLCRAGDLVAEHEIASLRVAAERMAARLGLDCEVVSAPCRDAEGRYWIPASTLSTGEAAELGIFDGSQLWGGVVPFDFVATKLVSHPLWEGGASAPAGWRDIRGIAGCTLPGHSVFSPGDAAAAGKALLAGGAIRVKHPHSRGGHGQSVIRSEGELEVWLGSTNGSAFDEGIVLERDLVDSTTYSVGSSTLAGLGIAYHGRQRGVADREGSQVYGGSTLTVIAGDLTALHAQTPPGELADAIDAAMRYDRAVREGYGVVATRSNYDVIAGVDDRGVRHLGVLEQSWRFGGASMAEVLAAERFAERPGTREVVAETVESYADEPVPGDALVYWPGDGTSPRKHARILRDGY